MVGSRVPRMGAWRLRLLGAFLLVLAPALPASSAVTPGDYCVSGLGDEDDDTVDGWLTVVTPAGTVTDLTPGAEDFHLVGDAQNVAVDGGSPGGSAPQDIVDRVRVSPDAGAFELP